MAGAFLDRALDRAMAWAAVVAMLACATNAVAAEPAPKAPQSGGDLLSACFAPAELRARPEERLPVRGPATAGTTPPRRTLAPFEAVPSGLRGAIRRVDLPPGSRKLIALTLDFCEQTGELAGYDGAIIDYLRKEKVRATLFAGGKWLVTHAERSRQLIADPLFEVANHAWAHRNLRLITGSALADEIRGPQLAYEGAREALVTSACAAPFAEAQERIPPRMGLFRFPFGACNAASLAAVADAGLLAIQWDVSTGDPSPTQSARAIADILIRRTRPGSIIIAHANGRGHHTAAALPLAIPRLKAMGFEFVTVGELLKAGKPVIAPTCYDSQPGDTDRYDHLFAGRPSSPRSPDALRPSVPR